ncbi:FHA domain-containing protein [Actinomycetospora sp. TBRC 11914]|uniref:FHA domain-containing protein n=1 Tax=Actinomycetospora sp. TBRC 11914 TaxID=2729387 RepID=UPI00145C7A4D|nr:FHA domain-containing protein [Actinomycetospora sp. TBRC 11914]NMO90577.1 FHA domain-containing protein [Actinomycetospora sp. TBRC 11914]
MRQEREPARRLPLGGLALLDVRTERRLSVPWGETVTIGRNAASDRHVHVGDDQVSRVAAEIEVRDDAYLVINRQRHGGQLTLVVPGVAGQDRIRAGNGLLVRDSRASLGLWLADGREVTLALLAFGPLGAAALSGSHDLAGGATVNAALPTDETWWSVLVAACGPTLLAAARAPDGAAQNLSPSLRSPQHVHGDADQIAAWHREAGRPVPSPKTQSEAFRHAQRWLRGVRLNDKTRGWRVAVVDQVIGLRLVTLDDVRRLFPAQVPAELPGRV